MSNQRFIFTGGPGAGKTAVLTLLQAQGFICVEETARKIIQARIKQGLSPRPDAITFAAEIFAAEIFHYDQSQASAEPVFFDRGIGDALFMLSQCGAITWPAAIQQNNLRPYNKMGFHFPAWEEIYRTDDERDQTYAEAIEISESLKNWYEAMGYTIVSVPQNTVANRLDFILNCAQKYRG